MSETLVNDALSLILAAAAGAGLGAFFFGGLWWTVCRGAVSERPALWFLGSLLGRVAVVLAGFYLVAGQSLVEMLACLFGFTGARIAVTRLVGLPDEDDVYSAPKVEHGGAGHAP